MANSVSCKIYLHYDSRPSDDWTYNLEYLLGGDLESAEVDNQTIDLVTALQAMHLDNVVIDRFVWSTWQPDSSPYDPEAVRTIPVGVLGDRVFVGTDPVDDDLALLVRKDVSTGRNGRIYFKGVLVIANLEAAGGAWQLDDAIYGDFLGFVADLSAMLSSNAQCVLIGAPLLSITYPATAAGEKQVPIRNYAETPTVRSVSGLVLVNPTERQARQ